MQSIMSGQTNYGNNFSANWYWTSNEVEFFYYSNYNNAYVVYTNGTANIGQSKTSTNYVRCVRDI
jgi:hypothetical protein